MTRPAWLAILLLAATLPCGDAQAQRSTRIEVRFEGDAARSIQLQPGSGGETIEFSPDPDRDSFVAVINLHADAGNIGNPYDLVIDWPEPNETIYLALDSISPAKVGLGVDSMQVPSGFKLRDLEEIEGISNADNDSLLKKFILARRFFRHWRYMLHEPDIDITLRSAKVWFDASVNLVKRRPHLFRFDAELPDIISGYQARTRIDAGLRKRFARHFNEAAIRSAYAQMASAPYQFVGRIPGLVAQGDLGQAKAYNDLALHSFGVSPPDIQQAIVAEQGVGISLLKRNSAYIDALIDAQREAGTGDSR